MNSLRTLHSVLPVGAVLDGIYLVEELLGSGGFGKTYRVFDQQLRRQLAIKEYFPVEIALRDGLTVRPAVQNGEAAFAAGLARFNREARHLATFFHPNIVKVFRSFDANGTSYIVLEYVEGLDLEDWLTRHGRPPTQIEMDRLAAPLLNALETVHAANILHRDIQPKNIRIRSRDGTPVLLDFGIAKSITTQEGMQSTVIVAHGYAPTESYATGTKMQGAWTDIYSLGAVFYRALTGHPPATSPERLFEDQPALIAKIARPEDYRPTFLEAIDWALMLNPADRPQTVAAWRAVLLEGKASPFRKKDVAHADKRAEAPLLPAATTPTDPDGAPPRQERKRRVPYLAIAASAALGIFGAAMVAYGAFDWTSFLTARPQTQSPADGAAKSRAEALERERVEAERLRKQAEDEQKRKEAEAAADEERRRKEAEATAEDERLRKEAEATAAEERRRKEAEATAEEERRKEAERAMREREEEEARTAEAKAKQEQDVQEKEAAAEPKHRARQAQEESPPRKPKRIRPPRDEPGVGILREAARARRRNYESGGGGGGSGGSGVTTGVGF